MNLSFHSAASAFAAASSAAAFSASASSAGFSPSASSAGFSASSGSPSSTSASSASAAAPSAADFASAAVALSLAQVGEEGASAPVLASSMGILTASSFPDFAIAITCLLSCRRRRLRSQLRSCRHRQEPRRPGHRPLRQPQPRDRRRSASTQPRRACSLPAGASRPRP